MPYAKLCKSFYNFNYKKVRKIHSDLFLREVKLNINEDSEIEDYIKVIPAIENLSTLKIEKGVTFIIGENGMGKSTLLEAIAIACGFNPEGGSINFNFSSKDTHSNLYNILKLVRGIKRPKDGFFLRAESFYNVSSEIDRLDKIGSVTLIDSYGGQSLHNQSHGESFMSLMINRFWGDGLYILDEPEAALSPQRQLALIRRICQLVKEGSQFIIATHSPILMAINDADIFELSPTGINLVPYKETDHYIITKAFLDNPERILKEIID